VFMNKYGVNWTLILAANLLCIWPVYFWIGDLLQFPAGSSLHRHGYYFTLSIVFAGYWTFMFSLGYDKTLNDPKAMEKLRQKAGSRLARSRFRWLFGWGVMLGVVAAVSVVTRLVAGRPAWSDILT
jgi:hypothetical protein